MYMNFNSRMKSAFEQNIKVISTNATSNSIFLKNYKLMRKIWYTKNILIFKQACKIVKKVTS